MGTDATPDPATGFENILDTPPKNSVTTDAIVKEAGGVLARRLVRVKASILDFGSVEIEYTTGENEDDVLGVTLTAGALDDLILVVILGKAIVDVRPDSLARNGDPVISSSDGTGEATTGKKIQDGTRVNALGVFVNARPDAAGAVATPMEIFIDRQEAFNRVHAVDREVVSGTDSGNIVVEGTTEIAADTQNMALTLPDGAYDGQRKLIVMSNASFFADVTITSTVDGTANVYRLDFIGSMLHLVWNCDRWDFLEPSTGRNEVITDVNATAKKTGMTVFNNTTGGDLTLTVPDGDFNGQRKLVFGNKSGAGNVFVKVLRHILTPDYIIEMNSQAATLELIWRTPPGGPGIWITHIPSIDGDTIPSGRAARFLMSLSEGNKVQYRDIKLSGPDNALVLETVDLLIEEGQTARVNGASKTVTVSGVTLTPALFARTADVIGSAVFMELFGTIPGFGPTLCGTRARGTSGAPVLINSGDRLLSIHGAGYDGTDYEVAASILLNASTETPGDNDIPGEIVLATRRVGGSLPLPAVTVDHEQGTEIHGELQSDKGRIANIDGTAVSITLDETFHFLTVTAASVITLPNTAAGGRNNGRVYEIKRNYTGALTTISGNGANIDGSASVNMLNGVNFKLIWNGGTGEWEIR